MHHPVKSKQHQHFHAFLLDGEGSGLHASHLVQHFPFDKLFAAAKLWGYDKVKMEHIKFGTVLGADKRPYKTRSGAEASCYLLGTEFVQALFAIEFLRKPALTRHLV